jgi:integrase/recombinase XerD
MKMNVTLSKAIAGFRLSNEASGLSKKTVTWYNSNLKLFHKWIMKEMREEPIIQLVSNEHIRHYLSELRNKNSCYDNHPYHPKESRPLSPRTIRGYYASLSSFFNWIVQEEILSSSPMQNIPKPKTPKFLPNPLTETEVKSILKACNSLPESTKQRTVAMIMLLLDCGVRISELINLKFDDVEIDAGRAKILGKGLKERYVYFGSKSKKAVWKYISFTRPDPMANVPNLFLYIDGRSMKQTRFAHILKKLGKRAKVTNVHPHRFRRTAAIQFIRNGGNIFALQKLLGHESLEMVRRYVELASSDVEVAHRTASPVDRWNI